MSLWTPSGEHQVPREPAGGPGGPSGPPGGAPPGGGAPAGGPPSGGAPPAGGPDAGSAEEAQLAELRRQLADTPAEVVVANHCYGLFELAAVYLSQSPPRLFHARLAIDALGYLIDGLGDRLGEAAASLKDALGQLRLAYVQLDAAEQAADQGAAEASGN